MKAYLIVPLLLQVLGIAQPPVTLTATGNMTVPRTLHSATLLVAAGYSSPAEASFLPRPRMGGERQRFCGSEILRGIED